MKDVTTQSKLTQDQIRLVRETVAKGASDDELKLFLHRSENLGLDPFVPGQIHFIKYGTGPGTIVVGLDGFRTIAANTGFHVGTKRGVIKDNDGHLIGAWAEVYRSDWVHPAREEVSLSEYNTGKGPWVKIPETMIKKVAECAALRMAFPKQLGGVYEKAEMDQAERSSSVSPIHVPKSSDKISDNERRALFDLLKKHNVALTDLESYLKDVIGLTSTKDMTIAQYKELSNDIKTGAIGRYYAEQPMIEDEEDVS